MGSGSTTSSFLHGCVKSGEREENENKKIQDFKLISGAGTPPHLCPTSTPGPADGGSRPLLFAVQGEEGQLQPLEGGGGGGNQSLPHPQEG